MTYILGSRCSDGVVLVADKKIITINGGAENKYSNKLLSDIDKVIIGYSGAKRIFESFRNDIIDCITSHRDTYKEYPAITKIYSEIKEIIYKLSQRYRGESFDLLVGVSWEKSYDNRSQLNYFYYDGTMELVMDYKAIGTGEPYGSIYLKQNWQPDMTMKQVAELGYFIIKYIEKFYLDLSVGVNADKPQIWFIPDNEVDHCADVQLLDEYEENTRKRLERIEENKLHKLF
jgi:20S proteasome alpha/beta subunit